MKYSPIQLVGGLEAAGNDRLMIVRFLDGVYFEGEDRSQIKEICKLAFDPEVAAMLMDALQMFLERQSGDGSEKHAS